LATQEKQLEAQVDRRGQLAEMVQSSAAFCQRVQAGLAQATFAQKRTLVELLIDRVLVANGDVEIRYAIPTHPRGEMTRLCQLRQDHFHHVIQIVAWSEPTGLWEGVVVLEGLEGQWVCGVLVDGDHAREHRMARVQHLPEKLFGGVGITSGA
jgi:hypothetical protein